MSYLIDSDWVIDYLSGKPAAGSLLNRLADSRTQSAYSPMWRSLREFADIRIELRRQKRQINHRALDILIAATAIERNLILVTRNIRDYDDISGLHIYDLNAAK